MFFIDHGAVRAYCDEIFADKPKKVRQYLFNSINYGLYSNYFHEQEAEQYAQEYVDKLLPKIFSSTNNIVIKDFLMDSMGVNYQILDHKSSNKNFDMFRSELLSREVKQEVKRHNEQVSYLLVGHKDSKKDDENLKKITILNDKVRFLLCLYDNDQRMLILKHSLLAKEKHCFEIVISFLTTEMYIRKNNDHLIVRAALDLLRSDLPEKIKEQIFKRLGSYCREDVMKMIKTALASSRITK